MPDPCRNFLFFFISNSRIWIEWLCYLWSTRQSLAFLLPFIHINHFKVLLFDPYEYHMDLFNELCSPGWLASCPSCVTKTLTLDITGKLHHFLSYLKAILKGTIDFYHFKPLSLTLTIQGVTRSAHSKSYWLHFLPHNFIWSRWDLMWRWSNSSWTTWDFFSVRFIETREITAVLLPASKKTKKTLIVCIKMFMSQFDSNDMMIDTAGTWPWFKVTGM